MTVDRFDAIARKVGAGTDRRTLLRGLGGLALGSLGVLGTAKAGSAQEAEDETVMIAGRRCRRRCLRRCRRNNGDDCRERCCGGDDGGDD